jgi:modulator of FtsH protease
MDRYPSTAVSTTQTSVLATNKVLRNTYLLLGATLAFSAVTAGVAMAINLPFMGLWMLLPYFGLVYAVNATRNSGWGIVWTFALTGFLGLTLGPILEFYLKSVPNGAQLVMTVARRDCRRRSWDCRPTRSRARKTSASWAGS